MNNQPLSITNRQARMTQKILSIIIKTTGEIGEEQEVKIPTNLSNETPLFGKQGLFDSLGLVSLVVAVEQAIEDEFGVNVSLADEKAMSQKHSPYRTIGSLAEYASSLIQEDS